jgi:hypothetical protein
VVGSITDVSAFAPRTWFQDTLIIHRSVYKWIRSSSFAMLILLFYI